MGRGIFWLKLSDPRSTRALIDSSLIAMDGKIINLVQQYRGFSASDFDGRFHIPRHPITLQFPSLVVELHPIIRDVGAHFKWVMQDTFVDAVDALGVPRVKVAIMNPSSLPSNLEIMTNASTITQSLIVIGLQDQHLRYHGFGHQARVCPTSLGQSLPLPPVSPNQHHK